MDDKKITLKLNNRKETLFGIVALVLGIISLISFLTAVFISAFGNLELYNTKVLIGFIELGAMIISLIGIVFAYVGETTKETLKTYTHIGLVVNIIMMIFHVVVLVHGY
jgi:hypothetical protein